MTATAAILVEINRAYGSASSKCFLAAITEGEGGISWDTLFGAGTLLPPSTDVMVTAAGREWVGGIDVFPPWGGAAIDGNITHAAGAFQFEPASYAGAAQTSGRSTFWPQDQIMNAWTLAAAVFQANSGQSLHTVLEAGQIDLIPQYLMGTWPGGCDGGFPTRYANNLPLVMTTSPMVARKIARGIAILA